MTQPPSATPPATADAAPVLDYDVADATDGLGGGADS